jgi:hypothetical protein
VGAPKRYAQIDVLTAIKDSGAIVSTIARRLGCEWITAKRYIDKWESTRQAFSDEQETILDMAEGTLFNAIKEKDVQAAKWILATKGKKRGYSEKQEIEHTGGVVIRVDKDDADL